MVELCRNDLDLQKIADSGQCFRMRAQEDNGYLILAGDRALLTYQASETLCFDCTQEEFDSYWSLYFDLDTDYHAVAASVPQEDSFLKNAVQYGYGIRILRQEPWEMLATFLLSQRKNIPAIKSAVETLCTRYGKKIGDGLHAFPTAERLAACTEQELRACSLGYRAPYLLAAAKLVSNGILDLAGLKEQPDEQLMDALLTVPGVGNKVAGCVMLFGFHRLGAFPRDVWINRVIDTQYAGHFPVDKYKGYAGIIQQYIFYYARRK